MKLLLTGANGYIGARLLPVLLQHGHQVVCMVRDARRFSESSEYTDKITVITGDLLKPETLTEIPNDIDAAFYLVHSMGTSNTNFYDLEQECASNFTNAITQTKVKQIVYLGGIVNDEQLSVHLKSRRNVESILQESGIACTILRAAIIIGSGSASFEIIRDLTEKLPIMITPKWLQTRCQPIAIRDVLFYLEKVLGKEETYNKVFDIGGPDILSYKQMLLTYASVRKLKRWIITIPVLTPKLSSYWLYFITSTSYPLAKSLVDSMRNEVVCKNNDIKTILPHICFSYREALELAFVKIEQNSIISSWKDALNAGLLTGDFMNQIKVPINGCYQYKVFVEFDRNTQEVKNNIWSIGGIRGWYYLNWLWVLRGYLDKLFGGVGLRRGRRSPTDIRAGDALDFWRVLLADDNYKRLLLYAEMKLPGEAWLEIKILERNGKNFLSQIATFRPNGLWGRLYWYLSMPFHLFIFNGMARKIIHLPNL